MKPGRLDPTVPLTLVTVSQGSSPSTYVLIALTQQDFLGLESAISAKTPFENKSFVLENYTRLIVMCISAAQDGGKPSRSESCNYLNLEDKNMVSQSAQFICRGELQLISQLSQVILRVSKCACIVSLRKCPNEKLFNLISMVNSQVV